MNSRRCQELEREELRELVATIEVELGPVDETMVGEAEAMFDAIEARGGAAGTRAKGTRG